MLNSCISDHNLESILLPCNAQKTQDLESHRVRDYISSCLIYRWSHALIGPMGALLRDWKNASYFNTLKQNERKVDLPIDLPAIADWKVSSCGIWSHTHSSQHLPGIWTRLG